MANWITDYRIFFFWNYKKKVVLRWSFCNKNQRKKNNRIFLFNNVFLFELSKIEFILADQIRVFFHAVQMVNQYILYLHDGDAIKIKSAWIKLIWLWSMLIRCAQLNDYKIKWTKQTNHVNCAQSVNFSLLCCVLTLQPRCAFYVLKSGAFSWFLAFVGYTSRSNRLTENCCNFVFCPLIITWQFGLEKLNREDFNCFSSWHHHNNFQFKKQNALISFD